MICYLIENIQHKMFLYKNIPREIFHGGILVTNKKSFDCVNFHARSFFRCYFYVKGFVCNFRNQFARITLADYQPLKQIVFIPG